MQPVENIEIDGDMLVQLSDAVRECAAHVDTTTDAGREKHAGMERLVSSIEALLVQCGSLAFQKAAREMQGKAAVRRSSKSMPYRVAFLVKAMLLAGVLRSSKGIFEALECSVNLLLPHTLRPLSRGILHQSASILCCRFFAWISPDPLAGSSCFMHPSKERIAKVSALYTRWMRCKAEVAPWTCSTVMVLSRHCMRNRAALLTSRMSTPIWPKRQIFAAVSSSGGEAIAHRS